jgi:hypothetical protein
MKLIQFIKTGYLKLIFFLVITSVTWVNFNHVFWENQHVIDHDVNHYYSYLPAFFYEKDLTLSFLNDTINQKIESRYYQPNKTINNKLIIKMSMGMAISYLPFFTAAHFYCKLFNLPANGFSPPYHFALQFSTLIYFLIGLFFLWKVLLNYFNKPISIITLLLICFATNVFFYLTFKAALSHIIGFTGIAMFLYYIIKWHNTPNYKTSIKLGLLIGFLTLVRPINILIVLIFVFYNVTSLKELKNKIIFFWKLKTQIFTLVLFAFIIVLPQLIYWKTITGSYFFNSYINEGFYFYNPHVFKALFGFRKGWFIYTPIMLFSIIGITQLFKTNKNLILMISIFLCVYIYVAFSWWCWWYGGSFSQRVMIDVYPLLAIPLAAFINYVFKLSFFKKSVFIGLFIGLTLLNLFQTTQAKFNIIHYDSMTFESYIKSFGVITNNNEIKKLYKSPDYKNALKGIEEREN